MLAGDRGVHLRELARRTGLDPAGVQRELRKLTKAGIVLERRAGNQKEYSLNRRCPVYPELRMMIVKTIGLADELRTSLEPLKTRIQQAFIYGSFASGTDRPDSDIDLMIVGRVSLREVAKALSDAGRTLSRVINPTVLRPEEYEKRLGESNSFVQLVASGDRIMLIEDGNDA
jgi:predicted nucleotidyltransferase